MNSFIFHIYRTFAQIALNVFGFYPDSNMDNIVKGIKILKDLSLEDIQKKLVESGIGSNIAEAMNYTQNMLTESEKRFFYISISIFNIGCSRIKQFSILFYILLTMQNMLTESEKRFFEKFCFESWGGFNRD